MNDFTKAELEFLYEMIKKYQHADLTSLHGVFGKIKSMIDNYGKHSPQAYRGDI